jgi:CO/xanthine dehydrogenase Mo-binding subunit
LSAPPEVPVPDHFEFEPERYELAEPPAYTFQLDRREFLGVAGLLLAVWTPPAAGQRPEPAGRLHLGADGIITVFSGKVEVGQGARVEIAMAAAEELHAPLDRVRAVLGDTELTPNDGITAGSRTTPSTVPAVRRAAAGARELLLRTASEKWNVPRELVVVRNGAAVHPKLNMTLGYAELAGGAANTQGSPTPLAQWRILGKDRHRTDGAEIVTGRHQYPSDIRRPGMLFGAVLRAPAYNSKLTAVDLEPAKAMPGVVAVHDGPFAGCAAPSSHAARKAVAAMAATAKWDTAPHPDSATLYDHLKTSAHKPGARAPRTQTRGDCTAALAAGAKKWSGVYKVAYIQHAPMEPRAAAAEWENGKLTVWTATQNPFGVRDQLAQAFSIAPEKVRVIVPDSGGAFGGKHTGECAIEAARLARAANKPVSLLWSRQEEFAWAYFRPAGLFAIDAALDASGKITAWDFRNYNSGTAALDTPYAIANVRTQFLYCDSPLREGSYRGIAATANHFARECAMDELAALAGESPLAFRLRHIDNPRLRAVLEQAAEKFGFEKRRAKLAPNTGVGLACGTEKGSYIAICAELAVIPGQATPVVKQLTAAFECGAILNPANLKAQVDGSLIQGLGGALTEEIAFRNGQLENGRFSRYKVPRFRDVPPIETILVNRPDLEPAGAGETPIVAVAPAIANAFFSATGKRARSMPVRA